MPEITLNKTADQSISKLSEWLFSRVGDENDIIIDEIQEIYSDEMEKFELSQMDPIKGSVEYLNYISFSNREHNSSIKTGPECVINKQKNFLSDGLRECCYSGHKNAMGEPEGEGSLQYKNNGNFHGIFYGTALNRKGTLVSIEGGSIRRSEGEWRNGLMEGEMRIDTEYGGWIEGYWSKGVPHGFQREFGPRDLSLKRTIKFVGRYFRGIRRGICWLGFPSNVFLVGKVDRDGEFTGKNIAFIYPDFKTALRGSFDKGKMICAHVCEIVGCKIKQGIMVPIFSDVSGPGYVYENPSMRRIAINPTMSDPWENTMVVVKKSSLPQGGEGLFLKQDVKAKTVISLFNGVRLSTSSFRTQYLCPSDYKIRLNADVDLDIPNDFTSINNYCATLGHKANHSFSPNAVWSIIHHPRFGLIRALTSQTDIKQGEEVFVNYHMNLSDAPHWYMCVWYRWQTVDKGLSDEGIKRLMDRYYNDTGKRMNIPGNLKFEFPDPVGVLHLK